MPCRVDNAPLYLGDQEQKGVCFPCFEAATRRIIGLMVLGVQGTMTLTMPGLVFALCPDRRPEARTW